MISNIAMLYVFFFHFAHKNCERARQLAICTNDCHLIYRLTPRSALLHQTNSLDFDAQLCISPIFQTLVIFLLFWTHGSTPSCCAVLFNGFHKYRGRNFLKVILSHGSAHRSIRFYFLREPSSFLENESNGLDFVHTTLYACLDLGILQSNTASLRTDVEYSRPDLVHY